MKRSFLFFLFLIATVFPGYAQKNWFDLGMKGSFFSSWLMNANMMNDKYVRYVPSYGYCGGGKIGYSLNPEIEFTADFLYSNFTQELKDNISTESWSRKISLTSFDIPVLFRRNKEVSFSEVGIQYSSVLGAKESLVSSSPSTLDYSISNAKNNFVSSGIAAVFGFGSFLGGTENNTFIMGFRFTYGLQDILSSAGGKGQNYPSPPYPGYNSSSSKTYKATHPLTIGLTLEVNHDLGYLVRSGCRRHREFLFF